MEKKNTDYLVGRGVGAEIELEEKFMICRKCKKLSEPITFGYCRECARKMGAKFQDELLKEKKKNKGKEK
jgi:hypothetical protein